MQDLSDEQWERVIHRELAAMMDSVLPGGDLRIVELTLSWRRTFEMGIVLA